MNQRFYRWKYNSPEGMGRIAVVSRQGEILGSSAAFPMRVLVGQESVIGWHCVDVATLPRARRQGHLLSTLRALVESTPPGDALFAFPNSGSIGAFHKLGFTERGVVTTWLNPLARLSGKRDPGVERIAHFGPEQEFSGTRRSIVRLVLDRGAEYLRWRYNDRPGQDDVAFVHRGGDQDGLCVARTTQVMGRELILIMDLVASSPGIELVLLRHIASWARAEGIGKLVMVSTAVSTRAALGALFIPVPSVLLPKRQVLVVAATGELATKMSRTNWAVQTGDWDVF